MSLIDNLTFKCFDINKMDLSFNFNKDTYFHKDYYLHVTDFQFLMTVQGVHFSSGKQLVERSNDN